MDTPPFTAERKRAPAEQGNELRRQAAVASLDQMRKPSVPLLVRASEERESMARPAGGVSAASETSGSSHRSTRTAAPVSWSASSRMSASTMILASSWDFTSGFQPSSSSALDASPISASTSLGRSYFGS